MNRAFITRKPLIKVSIAQFKPAAMQKEKNLRTMTYFCQSAHHQSADLVLFPEMALTGYLFDSYAAALPYAEDKRGQSFEQFTALAKKWNLYIVYGYPEIGQDGVLYNSQNFISPEGALITTYRKMHLFHEDERWAAIGDLGYQSIQTDIGKIGFGICMDMNFDALKEFHIHQKTDLVAVSSCWLAELENTALYWCNRWAGYRGSVAIANTYGAEQDYMFAGYSCLIQNGSLVAHCSAAKNESLTISVPAQATYGCWV